MARGRREECILCFDYKGLGMNTRKDASGGDRGPLNASETSGTLPPGVARWVGEGAANRALNAERRTSGLREQFIAVLGHDLRNPLSAIVSGLAVMCKSPLNDRQTEAAKLVEASALRISALVDDLMDFARGRLGAGMVLTCDDVNLEPVIAHVVNELRVAHPSRDISLQVDLPEVINCDHRRLSQLLSNLIANALFHGSQAGPVTVKASVQEDRFALSVGNQGLPIPLPECERLFLPFARGELGARSDGLGLGLYVCSEIARAHNGGIRVVSDASQTVFTFEMPLPQRLVSGNIIEH